MSRPLAKRRSLLEYQWPWLVMALFSALATTALVLGLDAGLLADYEYFPAVVRGYTLTGLVLGVACVGLGLLSFAYSLRKRTLQERMPVGSMAGWLWGHVYLGLLCGLLALAHAGYGSVGLELSIGKLLLLLLFLLLGSGLLWRIVYGVVPPRAAREVGHYSQAASHAKAQSALVEIEKLAAGRSPALHGLMSWLLQLEAADAEIAAAARSVPPDEQALIGELVRLSRSRHQLLRRERRQASYARALQGMRVLHVPLSLAFLLLLPVHVLWGLDIPAKVVPLGAAFGSTLGGFHPSSACASCHQRVVNEWRSSMHAHALSSPLMIAQTNVAHRETLTNTSSPDPQQVCVACHGPLATALAQSPKLPFSAASALADAELYAEGVTCAVCHQWRGEPETGSGALSKFQKGLVPGKTYFGSFSDPVGNAFHRSEASELFKKPSELCRNCHSVQYDRNGDGKVERGTDLVLQSLFDEWQDFERAGGGASCVDCHMPVVKGSRAAESALIPLEQDTEAPARTLRSHAFVAVDYPLDNPTVRDAARPEREALLRRAATLVLEPASLAQADGSLRFTVSLTNSGTGHNLPGGFAFVRQMWLEVSALDAEGRLAASSGRLVLPTDDLCDGSILDDPGSSVRALLAGCSATDRELVSFQQMLVDKIELVRDAAGTVALDLRGQPRLRPAPGAKEAVVQFLTGGPVPRARVSTGQLTPALVAGESRQFPYRFELPPGMTAERLSVRLLFRALPPYFVRALTQKQQPGDGRILTDLLGNLEINEMARVEVDLPRPN